MYGKRMKKRMGMMVEQPENPTLPSGGPTPRKPKPKAPPAMARGPRGRGRRAKGGKSMYAQGGSVQPVYGSTVADAMPKGMKN